MLAPAAGESLPVKSASRGIDLMAVIFHEPNRAANAGWVLVPTLARRPGLERLCDATIDLSRPSGAFGTGARY